MNASIIVSDEEEQIEDECIETEDLQDAVNMHHGNRLLKSTDSAKGGKIPEIQKERLVQLVQNNFLKAFGRFSAVNGKHAKTQLWRDIANELNTLGPHRTGEQWKTTFDNIKASAKAKLADDHNNIDCTIHKPLTRLEEKVLSIYGIDTLDGNQGLGEAGFQYDETVPAVRRAASSTSTQEFPQSTVENNGLTQTDSFNGSHADRACQGDTSISQDEYADVVLEEILREIREEHSSDAAHQSALGEQSIHGRNSRLSFVSNTSAASPRRSLNHPPSSETQNVAISGRGTSASRAPVSQNVNSESSIRASSVSCSQSITRGGSSSSARGRFSPITSIRRSNSVVENDSVNLGRGLQGSQNRVRGVPRLRGSSSSTRGRFSPISNIQQFFNDDYDEDERVFENSRREHANGSTVAVVDKAARDRSSLRHRYTSYEMVSRSIDAQEEFIEQDLRNHSEVMYATERNHLELLGIFNSTLRTIADVAKGFVSRI